jgi:hypothetical protein
LRELFGLLLFKKNLFRIPRRKFFRKKFSLIVVDSRLRHSVNADYEQKITYTLVFLFFIFSVLWRYVDFTKAHRAAKARIFLPVSPQKIRSATLQIKIFLITLSPQKKFIKKYFFVRSDIDFFFQIAVFRKETSMTGKLRSLLDASMIWRTNT